MTENIKIAIIGGSGLYEMSIIQDSKEYMLETPFGKPSAPIIVGNLKGRHIAFLARHGLVDAWQRFERQFLSDAP